MMIRNVRKLFAPVIILITAIAVIALITLIISDYKELNTIKKNAINNLELEYYKNTIDYQNLVLNRSTILFNVSKEDKWKRKYYNAKSKITIAIRKIDSLLDNNLTIEFDEFKNFYKKLSIKRDKVFNQRNNSFKDFNFVHGDSTKITNLYSINSINENAIKNLYNTSFDTEEIKMIKIYSQIFYFDELLRSAVFLYAHTEEISWLDDYDTGTAELVFFLQKAQLIEPSVLQTINANTKLVEIENNAIELTLKGKKKEAISLLNSEKYDALKVRYFKGMELFKNKTNITGKQLLEKRISEYSKKLFLSVSLFLLLVLLTTTLIFYQRKLNLGNYNLHKKNKAISNKNEELEEYAHVLSHDLKTPLRHMSYFMHLIKESSEENSEVKKNSEQAISQATYMEDMINKILEYSQSDNEKENDDVDLKSLLEDIISKYPLPNNFQINIKSTLPKLFFNPTKLRQLFLNLIDNAVKYNDKEQGTIEIGHYIKNDKNIIYLKDNGIGMTEINQKKIFNLFYTTTTSKTESQGIGLSVVKKIVLQMDGKISIDSTLGKGSTFYIHLPIKKLNA